MKRNFGGHKAPAMSIKGAGKMNVRIRRAGLVMGMAAFALAGCDAQTGINDTAAGRSIPGVTGAKSLSSHYVEVTFADSVGDSASDAARYVITDPQSGRLSVTRAEVTSDPKRVLLTTDGQNVVEYGLRVDRSPRPGEDAEAVETEREIAFAGDNGPEPCILYAIALNNTQVLITFDLTMDTPTTQDPKYYEFTPQLGVSSVVLDAAKRTAVMTTNPQQNLEYSLRVTNVKSGPSAYYLIDPVCNEVAFHGIPPVDSAAPKLADAQAVSSSRIQLRFSEPVDDSAGNAANYSIVPSLAIVGAQRNEYGTLVALDTLPMTAGVAYTVTAANIRDLASPGNLIDPAFVSKSFTFSGQTNLGGNDDMPRVVGAISTSNTNVRVAFNRVMGEGLENPLHYEISGSDTAYVMVQSVTPNADRTWVDLETVSQNSDLYTLHVVNVKDSEGNTLAALDGLLAPPFGFDPTRATFRGTPPSIDFERAKLYGVDEATDKLIVINPATGVGAAVGGVIGFTDVQGLTFDPQTKTLYGVNAATAQLIRVNTETGAGTAIGAIGFTDVRALAFDPGSGKLYGANNSTDQLITINTATGAGTAVGALGFTDVQALAFNSSEEVLYGANVSTDQLITINTATGAGTAVGALGFTDVRGLAFDPNTDTLYGADDSTDKLVTINPATGAGTAVGAVFGFTGVRSLAFDPGLNEHIDSDGDGFADWFEQLGWFVTVHFDDGTVRTAHVTSNPFSKDTDGDGIWDGDENRHNFDPRTDDTDADQVTDGDEYNIWFSDPRKQDSDGDGNSDLLEITFFFTSPILDDTDGDGFTDDEELFTMNRNPLIADLPLPQIKVQDIAIELNITTSYTDEEGTTQSQSQTTSTTFGQSRTDTLGTSDTATTQSENEFGQEIGFEGGFPLSFSVTASASFSQSLAAGFSSTVNAESASTSSQEYQESITSSLEFSQNRSVTRNIESAIVQATVNIANKSDLAFSITNIELSLLQQDRTTGLTFVPIAALRPTGAADTTAQPVYNLGPLDNERGPIIFENTTVFPNRIDALMREPVGLIFEVVNFDVFDEAGRNLVFTSQDVVDRTVGITIDFGDGRVESYRVATASTFDENGKPVGISLKRALEIAGLTKEGPGNTDEMNTYDTDIDARLDEDNNNVNVEVLVRVRDVENTVDGRTFWTAITSDDRLTPFDNFTEMVMHSHESILLLYTSDLDADGLFLREEYLYGSDDEDTDSDDDTLLDYFEVRTGWTVIKVPGLPYKVFPSPARPDSDMDGLDDKEEFVKKTDPNRKDTDMDGLSDPSEIEDTYTIVLFDGNLDITDDKFLTVAPYSDWAITAGPNGTCNTAAASGDDTVVTQNGTGSKLCIASGPNGTIDTLPSGDDKVVATAKIDPGPDGICQTTVANPGLPASCTGVGAPQACCTGVGTGPTCNDDVIEYSVANNPPIKGSVGKVCVSAGLNDELGTVPAANSDDFIRVAHKGLFATDPVREDTDIDGIGDGREGELGINPNSKDAGKVVDTDGDGLFDDEEDTGWAVQGFVGLIKSDKNHPDTDRDGIPDVIERAIASHPNRLDTDGDTILDYLEFETSNPLVNGVPMFNTVALATAIQQCNDATHCSYTAPLGALQTDTNPTKADTDTDGRNDNTEINVDCSWQVYGGSLQTIKSDPRKADEDGDGRNDGLECVVGGTNPKDADTDDDLRNDGAEVTATLNPLRKDKRISVTLNNYFVDDDCDGATLQGLELEGAFQIAYPTSTGLADGTFYTATCQGEEGLCDTSNCCCKSCDTNESACTGETFSISVASSQFIFQEGETFTLKSTELKDNDDLGGCGGVLENVLGTMSETVDFSVSLGTSVAVPVGSTGCQLTANYTITIHN